MKKNIIILGIFLSLSTFFVQGQKRTIDYKIAIEGNMSTAKPLSFWQVSNRYGLIPNSTNGWLYSGLFSGFTHKHAIDFSYGLSAAGYVSDVKNKIIIDEAFVSAKWKFLKLDLGCKHFDTEYNGISSTNGNLFLSDNTRSMPGIKLSTNYFSFPYIKRFIEFKGEIAEYLMNDKRFVEDTRLHTKAVYMKLKPIKSIELIAGFQHFAQWGGDSRDPKIGQQPKSFKDFLKVFFGKAGGSDASWNDRENLLGNHLGRQHYKINFNHKNFTLSAYLDRPFEDNSGLAMRAFPDALYGLYYSNKKNPKAWLTDVMYEFYYTKHQGGPFHDIPDPDNTEGKDPNDPFYGKIVLGGNDDYFNNSIYQSGWTYHGNIIGSPFFLPYAPGEDGITLGIRSNRFVAHYIGIKGYAFKKVPYTFRGSYSMNYGRYSDLLIDKPRQISLGLEGEIPRIKKLPFDIGVGLYADFGDLLPNNFGFTLKLSRNSILNFSETHRK